MIKIHPTAIIEENVKIGEGTSVWDNVHIRHGAEIGEECIVGEKTYIAYDVKIGNRVKINAMVYICAAVTIEDGVMISAGTIFTNDRFPRATMPDLKSLRPSEPDEHTLPTLVREGATIGAGCVIGNDLEIGRWAMVGMGSIVTKSVPDFHLVLGSPARSIGAVCKCGQLFHKFDENSERQEFECVCGLHYEVENRNVRELIMIDERFSAESFISSGIDTDESQKLADLLAEEIANELHKIVNAKVVEIVNKLNSMGHSLKPEYESKIGDISFRDDRLKNEKYQCKLRLGVDTVISTGYSHLIDLN